MTGSQATAGYLNGGMPYNRFGDGARDLVIALGLGFENRPMTGLMARITTGMYKFLADEFTVYVVTRKPGLSVGTSMKDMGDDYAAMIREEFGRPVDVIGVSTGGSIVQHLAADHPDVIRRLVIHSSAHRLRDEAKQLQLRLAELAREREWRAAYATGFAFIIFSSGPMKSLARPLAWLASLFARIVLGAPDDPSDLVITVEAEDVHDFKDRLSEIKARTLVVAGDKDPVYTEALFRETAAGIPDGKLILYEGMGHPASGKQFSRDVLAFLSEGREEDA